VGKERYNYGVAYGKSADRLRLLWKRPDEFVRLCEASGCRRTEGGVIIPYFREEYVVKMPEGEFRHDSLPMNEKILLLHYLLGPEGDNVGRDEPVQRSRHGLGGDTEWISFTQLPGAAFYEPTYKKRGPNLIVKFFRSDPDKLTAGGTALGGEKGDYGDVSVLLHPFPHIDVMLILYRGDDEFPPEGQILFSGSIGKYLSLEDTAVLAGVCVVKCMKETR
jgi:hypothetical protein